MKRTLLHGVVIVLGLTVVFASLTLVGGCKKHKQDVPETPIAASEAQKDESATASGDTATDQGSQPAQTPANTPAGGDTAPSGTNTPSTLTIRVAWVEAGEAAFATERTIPYTPSPATAALDALLAGPTQQELTTWPAISTCIPAGTKLLGLSVSNGVARVDLSKEFESGGGTFSVTARLAQVVYTLTQFPSIQAVDFYIEGQRADTFSSEGLMLDGPQTIEDYQALLPMDA